MRRSNKYSRPVRPLNVRAAMGGMQYEEGSDGARYKVQHIVSGQKEYLCPGCNGIILIGESHEVAWTEDTIWGAQYGQDSRRHWHTSCWKHRGRR
ncbi:MAG: ATP/GTP-binding protein [Ancrocorticia sp.]